MTEDQRPIPEANSGRASSRRPLKGVAFPTEHGSWGVLFEPVIAAAAVYPSVPAIFITLSLVGALLLRQPLKVLLLSGGTTQTSPKKAIATRFAIFYLILLAIGVAGMFRLSATTDLEPLLVLIPLGIFQLFNDSRGSSRGLIPELAGAAGIPAVAASIVLAGGGGPGNAAAFWILFASRSVSSFVYVRQRLRLEKGKAFVTTAPLALHIASIVICGALAMFSLIPVLPVLVLVFLLVRCGFGLSERRRRMKAMEIGTREVFYGAALTLAFIFGAYLSI